MTSFQTGESVELDQSLGHLFRQIPSPNGLFLLGHVKTVVYLSKPLSLDELKVRIANRVRAIIELELKNIFKS
jgi:hypothetical protein